MVPTGNRVRQGESHPVTINNNKNPRRMRARRMREGGMVKGVRPRGKLRARLRPHGLRRSYRLRVGPLPAGGATGSGWSAGALGGSMTRIDSPSFIMLRLSRAKTAR